MLLSSSQLVFAQDNKCLLSGKIDGLNRSVNISLFINNKKIDSCISVDGMFTISRHFEQPLFAVLRIKYLEASKRRNDDIPVFLTNEPVNIEISSPDYFVLKADFDAASIASNPGGTHGQQPQSPCALSPCH